MRHVMNFGQFSVNEAEAKKGNSFSYKALKGSTDVVLPKGSKKVVAGYAADWGSDSKLFSTDANGVKQAKEWLNGQMQKNKQKLTGAYSPNLFYFCAVLDEKNPPKPAKKEGEYRLEGKFDQTRPVWAREVEQSVKQKSFDDVVKGEEGLLNINVLTPEQLRQRSQEDFETEDR